MDSLQQLQFIEDNESYTSTMDTEMRDEKKLTRNGGGGKCFVVVCLFFFASFLLSVYHLKRVGQTGMKHPFVSLNLFVLFSLLSFYFELLAF